MELTSGFSAVGASFVSTIKLGTSKFCATKECLGFVNGKATVALEDLLRRRH